MSDQVAAEMAVDIVCWVTARDGLEAAIEATDRAVGRAARQVLDATGGIGLRHWKADCRRRRMLTTGDALRHARALRARPAVESALARQRETISEADRAVAAARADLAAASTVLLRYGNLGAAAAGVTVPDLRRLARGAP